jgi:hypothetical protein
VEGREGVVSSFVVDGTGVEYKNLVSIAAEGRMVEHELGVVALVDGDIAYGGKAFFTASDYDGVDIFRSGIHQIIEGERDDRAPARGKIGDCVHDDFVQCAGEENMAPRKSDAWNL